MAEENYIARMHGEYGELNQRIDKLKNFIISDNYDKLPDIDKSDLKEQLKHMQAYFEVLSRRVSRSCNNA